ncbi:MAG: symmetrical bis(5'-nucleosyl)-tetraphosphatase [Nitrosomonas sp.]|nr:symmetrical bis(5'-nucleosyl)-tetraphosphatase [Nitrosomonas sp.]
MSTYAIGDLQGCYQHFQQLLDLIGFSADRDRLWLVGDVVNRGPDSLMVLRALTQLDSAVTMVLGNHDLHLLMVAEGVATEQPRDTLQSVLQAPDRENLLDWLRRQPLFYSEDEYVLVHAGLLPDWEVEHAGYLAQETEAVLRCKQTFQEFAPRMYGNTPGHWQDKLQGEDRWRVIINAMTRLRICTPDGKMNFSFKGNPATIPAGYLPWFDIPHRANKTHTILFGHWSALGLRMERRLISLDTGCLWGGSLTAVRLEDRKIFQVPCV